MKKGYLENFKAGGFITGIFLLTCLFSLIPEWVYPGDPDTDEIYDLKVKLMNVCWSFKACIPPLLLLSIFRKLTFRIDFCDYIYLGLYFFTCLVDVIDAFTNPYRDTFWDWIVVVSIWTITTIIKVFNYKKTG